MAEVIDVVCDVCGQKYRWSDDRLGRSASCRECSTTFEVAEYIPPPDDDAEGGNDSPLPWIKGAVVAALIVAALGGLGSLLFHRPSPDDPLVADRATASRPAVTPSAKVIRGATPAVPVQNLLPRSGTASLPNSSTTSGFGLPDTGSGSEPISQSVVGSRANENMASVSSPKTRSRGELGNPTEIAPEPDPRVQNDAPISTPVEIAAPEGVPVVTAWNMDRRPGSKRIRLTGRGLMKVTKVEQLVGYTLNDVPLSIVSDAELEITTAFIKDATQTLFVVSCPEALAVAFSQEVKTVDSREALESGVRVCFVRKGGRLKSSTSTVVLVEAGGRVEISSSTPACFLKQDAVLVTLTVNNLIAEAGARVTQKEKGRTAEVHPRAITFCPLPMPD